MCSFVCLLLTPLACCPAGFLHYTEVLEGPDGAKALGWPGYHRSHVHTSPLLFDIDMDGIRDVMVTTFDGEVVFFKDNVSILWQQSKHTLAVAGSA